MDLNVTIPFFVGIVSLIGSVAVKFMPMKKDTKTQKLRHAMIIDYIVLGIYDLLVSLFSFIFNIDTLMVLYLIFGGIIVIGAAFFIPAMIALIREARIQNDEKNL